MCVHNEGKSCSWPAMATLRQSPLGIYLRGSKGYALWPSGSFHLHGIAGPLHSRDSTLELVTPVPCPHLAQPVPPASPTSILCLGSLTSILYIGHHKKMTAAMSPPVTLWPHMAGPHQILQGRSLQNCSSLASALSEFNQGTDSTAQPCTLEG
jgi:hypothetical protein